jgi:hypothetical protein
MKDKFWSLGLVCAIGILPACSGDDDDEAPATMEIDLGAANPHGTAGDDETPPTTNGRDVEQWLKQGAYKSWDCETVDHPQIKVSPHGQNRVCSNALAAAFEGTPSDERPVGTAAVKELLDDDSELVGYAVGVKIADDSDGGANWYWYERVPLDSKAPHNDAGVVADGLGSQGAAQSICVGCHAGAGSNEAHDVMGSSDYVYLQVAAR